MQIPQAARAVLESDALAHVVTIAPDGSPHVTVAWVGLEGDEILIGTLGDQKKLAHIRSDPRVSLSLETPVTNAFGLREYVVIKGRARVTEGGAPELLQQLAETYIGPDTKFPPMPDPPPGFVTRIEVDHVGGVGPWAAGWDRG